MFYPRYKLTGTEIHSVMYSKKIIIVSPTNILLNWCVALSSGTELDITMQNRVHFDIGCNYKENVCL